MHNRTNKVSSCTQAYEVVEARVWIQLVFEVWVFGAHACEQGGHKFFERAFFEVVVQVRSEWVTVSFGEGWMLAGFLASLCTRRPSSSRIAQTSVSKCAGNMKVEDDEEALWMEVSAHCSLNLEFQNQHTTNNTVHTRLGVSWGCWSNRMSNPLKGW